MTVDVDVAPGAPIGARDLSVGGAVKAAALVVYDKIDGLKVVPQAGMARVGGNVFPKQLQQFEAIGVSNGPDGKLDTDDDLELGLVAVKWSLEEFTATFGDDDLQYVGTIDERGLFTPNVDGPNPKRAGNRNNVGDVWVVAELITADPKEAGQPAARAGAAARDGPALHGVVPGRGRAMTAWAAREHHRFEAAGKPFVYLVPSAAIFALDTAADTLLQTLAGRALTREELSAMFPDETALDATMGELVRVQAIGEVNAPPAKTPKVIPLAPFPLTTMVLNVTNQCNLSCTYCYEYSEDKIVDTENGKQPKFMTEETARESVEFMLKESGDNKVAHITFFGGETLMNFPVLAKTIAYARQRGAEIGKEVDFSLTTNATLLKPDIIEFLADNRVGVTISIDGPKEVQDKFRVFHNGAGSYDTVAPKIKELLKRHRSRPIGARVTLTSGQMDIKRIYTHLTEEMGFWEVGFAPVTTSPTPRPRDFRRRLRRHAGAVPGPRVRVPRGVGRQPAPWVLEREGNARGTAQRREQGVSLRRGPRPAGRRHGRRRRALPPLRRIRRAQARHRAGRHRSSGAAGVSRTASRGEQDRLQHLLGAAALLGRLLSRGAHALRRYRASEPALLRMDPRVDRRVPADLR